MGELIFHGGINFSWGINYFKFNSSAKLIIQSGLESVRRTLAAKFNRQVRRIQMG